MGSEDYEIYKEMGKERQEEGEVRRNKAGNDFSIAKRMAESKGWVLKQHTYSHFQLISPGRKIIINLYPGNQRIYQDPKKRGPYLKIPFEWTLCDVVKEATKTKAVVPNT